MRVLLIANYSEICGGISSQVRLLWKCLNRTGIEADIFSTKGNPISRIKYFNVLANKAKEYDVIHVHCCSYFGFYPAIVAFHAAKKQKQRLILTYHGGGGERFFNNFNWLVKKYFLRTDANIVLSGFLANVFDKFGYPYSVIPNILEQEEDVKFSRTNVSPKFISIRTLAPLYNIQCIVKAFETVKMELPEATLDILAEGPCRQELEEYIANNDIQGISFLGKVPNSDINKYMQNNDVFLSMPKIDNQPVSVLEAWRNGLLVISSNVGGVPFLVENGQTGVLVESDNPSALAKAMVEAVKNPSNSLRIMRNGHKALTKYKWENIKNDILNIYDPCHNSL